MRPLLAVTALWTVFPVAEAQIVARGGSALPPHMNTFYDVEDPRGYEALTFAPFFITEPLWCGRDAAVWFNRVDDLQRPFLSFLNVRFALQRAEEDVPPGWRVHRMRRNGAALPGVSPAEGEHAMSDDRSERGEREPGPEDRVDHEAEGEHVGRHVADDGDPVGRAAPAVGGNMREIDRIDRLLAEEIEPGCDDARLLVGTPQHGERERELGDDERLVQLSRFGQWRADVEYGHGECQHHGRRRRQ